MSMVRTSATALGGLLILFWLRGPATAQEPSCQELVAGPVWVNASPTTGLDLVRMSDAGLRAYALGFVNGFLIGPLLGMAPPCYRAAFQCLTGRSDVQLAAILRKFLADNPERWHEGAHTLSYGAILAPCLR